MYVGRDEAASRESGGSKLSEGNVCASSRALDVFITWERVIIVESCDIQTAMMDLVGDLESRAVFPEQDSVYSSPRCWRMFAPPAYI
jgi:hypothetical protein